MSGAGIRTISADEDGIRLDHWFRQHYPALSHGQLQKMLRKGQVRLGGKRVKASDRVAGGQQVRIPPTLPPDPADRVNRRRDHRASGRNPADLHGMIIHEDGHVIVLNKPAGLAVQGGSRTYRHVDGMLSGLVMPETDSRPKLVHRLDKDTSGVLVVAKTPQAARNLAHSFKTNQAGKLYWALVAGAPSPVAGRVDVPISKMPGSGAAANRELAVPDENGGKWAVTCYETLEKAGREAAWLAFYPLTGRTHQLRVHAKAMGHPIIGDGKYGGKAAFPSIDGLEKQLHLHARALRIPHPGGGYLEVAAPLPPHMRKTWKAVGFHEADHGGPVRWPEVRAD